MSQPPGTGPCWRIDDLARRADVTVDTIRYYQREGLLPPGERSGRANLYGPEHLERLERIRELQTRRFSLAAIRALLSRERSGVLADLFAETGGSYTLDELVERAGVERALADDLRAAGALREPAELGRETYDADDLDLLRVLGELQAMGLPRQAIVELVRLYTEGIEATQRRVIDLFTNGGTLPWTDPELAEFRAAAAEHAVEILPLARRLVDYTHQRTIQRLTLDAVVPSLAAPGVPAPEAPAPDASP
jgi:DNA-binding transcriptional MerR regulator